MCVPAVALAVMPMFLLPLMVFSGFFVNSSTIPPYFNWCAPPHHAIIREMRPSWPCAHPCVLLPWCMHAWSGLTRLRVWVWVGVGEWEWE